MQAGKLFRKVTVQERGPGLDSHGQENGAWNTKATRRAFLEPLQGRELFTARQVHAEVTHRVTLRYGVDISGLKPKWRLQFDSKNYDVLSVVNTRQRKRELILLCAELV